MKLEVDLSATVEQQLSRVATRVWQQAMKEEFRKLYFPEWMDLETTAKYLNVSRSNLSKFIKELDFPVSVIAGTKRCNKYKVNEWMEQFEL
ncbi:hypothetical protein ACWN8V_07720 [Vagococcus elongatus]|uniref:DNA-binding protein n=1 Tax=Vagococcus elongatus TaxID=180344 RepID=A0A430AU25_9ENTE|nr:hypothetical protein [Vagococcus elongatus]RSU11554.1 hypothetical protein CBF29_07685 [Vagococcus elongatus]